MEKEKNKTRKRSVSKKTADRMEIYNLLPVITALVGVLLGSLLQYHFGVKAQQELAKQTRQHELFVDVWALQNRLGSKQKLLADIEREYHHLGSRFPLIGLSDDLKNYFYNKHLELRYEYFILNNEYNDILNDAWTLRGQLQVYFHGINKETFQKWDSVLLNWPQMTDPPSEGKKLAQWFSEEEKKNNEYHKYEFRPIIFKLLFEMGEELNFKVHETNNYSDTQKNIPGQD